MCLTMYLAADSELPHAGEAEDVFVVGPPIEKKTSVLERLGKRHVVEVTAEGCACAFMADDLPSELLGAAEGALEGLDEDDLITVKVRQRLLDYVRSALEREPEILLFAPWIGEEKKEPIMKRMTLAELRQETFEVSFDKPLLATIVA